MANLSKEKIALMEERERERKIFMDDNRERFRVNVPEFRLEADLHDAWLRSQRYLELLKKDPTHVMLNPIMSKEKK